MTLQHTLDEDNPVYFNSHPHEEDDLSSEMSSSTLSISTHILTRRMTTRNSQIVRQEIFQLTSSRGGWPIIRNELIYLIHFNSHPHEEDDDEKLANCKTRDISTHILTRRMTWLFIRWVIRHSISTHILTRRMTPNASVHNLGDIFQLTSSRGGWHRWGMTLHLSEWFQLTSSRGGWHLYSVPSASPLLFQLTSSRGGWRSCIWTSVYGEHFNSHPHEEDDHDERICTGQVHAFQLTSSRGGWLHPVFADF